MRESHRQLVGLGICLAGWAGYQIPALAQVAPQSLAPTREQVVPPPVPTTPERPRLEVEGDIERSPCPLADPAYADVRVTITSATFNNLKVVSPDELRPAYEAYLGQDRPVSVICEIRDAAATILRRKGYLAAVQVPTQRIENGNVAFEVLYAKIVNVRVRGDAAGAEHLIQAYLNRLTEGEVFNRFAAERYLLLARDLPGYDVRLSLTPAGTGPGELIGEVTVIRTPFEADFNVQNFGSKATGRFGGQIRAQFYGLTGAGDRTTVALYSTADFKEQQILQVGHDFRVGSEGLTLGGRLTYAWTQPDIGAGADVKARTLFANLEASYPFIRSRTFNLRGAFGLDYVDQTVRFSRQPLPLSRDRLRVAYLRVDGDKTDPAERVTPMWRVAYSLELRQGLNIFNPNEGISTATRAGPSRQDGDAEGTLIRFTGAGDLLVAPNVTVSVMPRAQYAFVPLLSFEEFSGGTYTIGRGYDPGALTGDSGIGASVEARINRIQPFAGTDLTVQPFVFVDSAWMWDRGIPDDPRRLTSVGGGMRASFESRFRLDLTVAVPTKRVGPANRRGDTRILVSLTTKLWPGAR